MDSDDFTPRLGRPGDRGQSAVKRYGARVKRASARLLKPKGKKGFTGARTGRGVAPARMTQLRASGFARSRMRRVIVKTHIARANQGIGKAAFRAHIKYIQRDGVRRTNENEREGGELYTRDKEKVLDKGFLERSDGDRHQFRIIVSAEDGVHLESLKKTTRDLMSQVEKDLGAGLDWVAVDHFNTGRPHTHIVIRGKDSSGKDLVIARDYLTQGFRARAQEIVSAELGPRRDMEIARAMADEAGKERYTNLDRELGDITRDGVVKIESASGAQNRFHRTLRLRRLRYLEQAGLAQKIDWSQWRMAQGWETRLKTQGQRGDIIRTIAAETGRQLKNGDIAIWAADDARQKPLLGRVAASGPEDELRDRRFILIDAADGKIWRVPLGETIPGAALPNGAVVEVSVLRAKPKQADRTIAAIADVNGGLYSPDLHLADDPSASPSFVEAHKRRLEALRRAGLVMRRPNGVFEIGKDYLEKAAMFERRRCGGANIDVKSWIDLDAQIEVRAPTWLDDGEGASLQGAGFGAEASQALLKRAAFLKSNGLMSDDGTGLVPARRKTLAQEEKQSAANAEASASGKSYRALLEGDAFEGVYERSLYLAQGRFALIARSKEFTLVPWRPELERHRGAYLAIRRTGKGIEWTLGKQRGIAR